MTQVVQVKGRKRKSIKPKEGFGIQEPIRKSMYDVVMENFKTIQRLTYLHRIIYIGEHTFTKSEQMDRYFELSILHANRKFQGREINTGILIRYNRHFIHMVEGEEDCIFSHFKSKNLQYLKNMKLIVQLHHINTRLTGEWSAIFASPVKLLTSIQLDSILEETSRQIVVCVEKIYGLIEMIKDDSKNRSSSSDMDLSFLSSEMISPSTIFPRDSNQNLAAASWLAFKKQIPEMERLEFLLKSSYPIDVKTYFETYWVVPETDMYRDKVWPIAPDCIPYDIFDSAYNINTEFPKPKVENKVTKDEEHLINEESEENIDNNRTNANGGRSLEK